MHSPAFLAILPVPLLLFAACKESPPPEKAATAPESTAPPTPAPAGMLWIPGGTYTRGDDRDLGTRSTYPEEQPVHEVTVDGFWMDETEVTNAAFLKFAEGTGYLTQAERGWSKDDFPNAPPEQLLPGALIFTPPPESVELWQPGAEWSWWQFVQGASWRHPGGPDSDIDELMDHPVRCITHEDALAYAAWIGKRLPTEAEWECAARGGLDHKVFVWGDEPTPGGKWLANVYQGEFPNNNTALDGFAGTAPVKSFPPNGYGLYDMAGNVWEMCSDLFRPEYYSSFAKDPVPNPTGPTVAIDEPSLRAYQESGEFSTTAGAPHQLGRLWVKKGGSHLCHHTYCLRYRPAARHYTESLSPASHVGFRCVKNRDGDGPPPATP